MESLIATIVILLLSVIANWAQKRSRANQPGTQDKQPPKPRPLRHVTPRPGGPVETPKPRPSSPRMEWEEQLRRLLRGEIEEPPRPAEPPPITRAEPPPVPHRPVVPRPVRTPSPQVSLPPQAPVIGVPFQEASETASLQKQLAAASASYDRARQLHEETSQRLKAVTERTTRRGVHPGKSHREIRTEEMAETLALLGSHRGIRKALIASIILGTPKGLEP